MPVVPYIIYGVIAAAVGYGTSAYTAAAEKSSQKKALEFQKEQVSKAEEAAAGAEKLAAETAALKLSKQRRSQTNTILTSPLGVVDEASTGKSSLLGG